MKMSSLKSVCIDDCSFIKNENSEHKLGPSEKIFPLHDAAYEFDCVQIKALLENGDPIDLNEKDGEGRTVLHVLLSDGFRGHLYETNMVECLQIITSSGKCDVERLVNAKDGNGETPLSLAVSNGFESCAIWLVQHGASSSVRTPKFKRMHSLPSFIAQAMPNVMMEIFNSGVTLEYVANDDTSGKPEVKVKLEWSPVLQFAQGHHKESNDTIRKHKYKQREMSFLYSLMDVSPITRNTFLTHPLVSAFIYKKSNAISKKLQWFQMLIHTYPLFYMLFIYFLYFNRCKIANSDDAEESTTNSVASITPRQGTTTEASDDDREQLCDITIAISVSGYLLMAIVGGFGLVEVYMQLRVDTRYLKSWRTWVLRISLVIMGLTLWPALQFNTLYNITWQYPIAALGIFFGWAMFLIQMELFPQVKIYLEMLVAITISVLKITLLFMPLLIGFYMGFNLMFFGIGGVMNFILMTVDVGSDEYEDMVDSAKDKKTWFMIISYVFSVAFIIIIAIVFMNFLLGVSINDIQELKRNAKIMALSNRIQKLFIIDLVLPTWYNVLPNSNGKDVRSYYIYGPYDRACDLPEDIRTQITLLLKSKYSQKNNVGFLSRKQQSVDDELVQRVENLERKIDSMMDEIRTAPSSSNSYL